MISKCIEIKIFSDLTLIYKLTETVTDILNWAGSLKKIVTARAITTFATTKNEHLTNIGSTAGGTVTSRLL